jgi:hypothetical protein
LIPHTGGIAASGVRLDVSEEDGSPEPDTLLAKTGSFAFLLLRKRRRRQSGLAMTTVVAVGLRFEKRECVFMIGRNIGLFRKVIPWICGIVAIKLVAHFVGVEFITVNPLFSGLVAANVFLLGFLLAGVLADYKESEKLPGDMAACLETIFDEAWIIHANKKAPAALEMMNQVGLLGRGLVDWFYKRVKTGELLERVAGLNASYLAIEPLTQPPFIARLKGEQNNLRRMIIRAHTIRETSFVSSGYTIAEATTILLTIGLLFSRIEPFFEALFFVVVICFLLLFMLMLIRDLDNPFGYYEKDSTEDVSLQPLEEMLARVKRHTPEAADGG